MHTELDDSHLLPGSSYGHSLGLHGDDSLDDSANGMGSYAYGASTSHAGHDHLGELGESSMDHYHRDDLDDSEDMGH